jgi:CRISPR-associated protein Cmr3
MPEKVIEASSSTPLFWRDGRPFAASDGAETAVRSLPLPLPSTFAGFVRTQVGNAQGINWKELNKNHDQLKDLHSIAIRGPLLCRHLAGTSELLFPAPKDAVIYKKAGKKKVMRLKPWIEQFPQGAGCDLPEDSLCPLEITEEMKPESGYVFWKQSDLHEWLLNSEAASQKEFALEKIADLPLEVRTHVEIAKESKTAKEGMLFSVGYRNLEQYTALDEGNPKTYSHYTLRARTKLEERPSPIRLGHLGGERRPAALEVLEGDLGSVWWDCPEDIKEAIANTKQIRMVLATPALFDEGWRPGWLRRMDINSSPAGMCGVQLKLVSAAVGRREAVSGWNMRENKTKPVRYMVPAGSVYFFEVLEGNPSDVLKSWLKSVSDQEQDRKDGFGLALWGVW